MVSYLTLRDTSVAVHAHRHAPKHTPPDTPSPGASGVPPGVSGGRADEHLRARKDPHSEVCGRSRQAASTILE